MRLLAQRLHHVVHLLPQLALSLGHPTLQLILLLAALTLALEDLLRVAEGVVGRDDHHMTPARK